MFMKGKFKLKAYWFNMFKCVHVNIFQGFNFSTTGCKGKESSFCDLYFDYKYNGTKKEGGSCCGNQNDYLCEYPAVPGLPEATPANQLKVSDCIP